MKRALLTDYNNFEIEEVESREIDPSSSSAVIRVIACAVCGSDLRTYSHGNSRVKFPQVIGHEVVGEVTKVGSTCPLKIHDKVCFGADLPCLDPGCKWCSKGLYSSCDKNYAVGYQFSGGFASEMTITENYWRSGAFKVINDTSHIERYTLVEPLACVIHGIDAVCVRSYDNVLIYGGGPVGIMIADYCKNIIGCENVIISEPNSLRRELIKSKFQTLDVISNTNDHDAVLKKYGEITSIFTANSVPACQKEAVELCSKHGMINFFGGLGSDVKCETIDTNLIHYKQLHVTASHGSGAEDFNEAFDIVSSNKLNMMKYITSTYSLDDITRAFESARNYDNLKMIIKP